MIEFKRKNITIMLTYALFSILLILLSYTMIGLQYAQNVNMLGVLILVQLVLNLISFNLIGIKPLSLSGLFVWLNYLFHLTQPIVKVIAPNYRLAFDVSNYVVDHVYYESIHYSLLIILATSLGVMLVKSIETNNKYIRNPYYKLSNISSRNLVILGLIILSFTFPIEFYIQLSRIMIAINEGYIATLQDGIGGITAFLANFSIVGFIMIILGSKDNKRRGTFVLVFYIVFYILTMFSGGRMWQIIKMVLVLYYYMETYEINIKGKNIVIFGILGYLLSGFLGAVGNFRAYDFNSSSTIIDIISDVFINNPILEVFDEFGGTVYTLSLVIEQTPQTLPFSYGKQFITNFIGILPNIGSFVDNILTEGNYVLQLKIPTIGGSYIGEMYYSFHYFGIFVSFLIGGILQVFTQKIEEGLSHNDYHFIVYSLMFQYSAISWVRGSSGIFYRNTVYAIVLLFIFTNILIKSEDKSIGSYRKFNV